MNRRSFIKTGLLYIPTIFTCRGGSVRLGNLTTEAGSWRQRVKENSGNYTSTSIVASDTMAKLLYAGGIRSKVKRMNIYGGLGLTAMAVCLIKDVIGSVETEEVQGFDEADFSESVGLTGNGTDEWLNTRVPFSTLYDLDATNRAVSYGMYVITAANHASLSMGHFDGTNYSYLAVAYSNTNTSFSMTANADGPATGDSAGSGFYLGVRNNATDAKIYKRGALLVSDATPGTITSTGYKIFVHAANNQDGGVFELSNKTYGGYMMGIDFDATQQAALNYAWQRTMGIFGRPIL